MLLLAWVARMGALLLTVLGVQDIAEARRDLLQKGVLTE